MISQWSLGVNEVRDRLHSNGGTYLFASIFGAEFKKIGAKIQKFKKISPHSGENLFFWRKFILSSACLVFGGRGDVASYTLDRGQRGVAGMKLVVPMNSH